MDPGDGGGETSPTPHYLKEVRPGEDTTLDFNVQFTPSKKTMFNPPQ